MKIDGKPLCEREREYSDLDIYQSSEYLPRARYLFRLKNRVKTEY